MTYSAAHDQIAITATKWQRLKWFFQYKWNRFVRLFPRLVWYGQEIDVLVTMKENKLRPTDGSQVLNRGQFYEIEKLMSEVGINFDTGMGYEGRDWEWDWSLSGPISVRFKSVCKTKNRRI